MPKHKQTSDEARGAVFAEVNEVLVYKGGEVDKAERDRAVAALH